MGRRAQDLAPGRAAEEACETLGRDRALILHFEDLIAHSRDERYRALLDFLHLEDEPEMRQFFDSQMDGSKAHSGRWREGLESAEAERRDAEYRAALALLAKGRAGGIGRRLQSLLGQTLST
ncbi:MAG TPA: hypothetical protein VMZ28_05505 [Kofleriaceae bacterium]|nr:hypothetical protein [Kofleriaceae bacterium]